jgi:hypothetical protein
LIESQTLVGRINNERPGLPRSRSHSGFEPPKHALWAVRLPVIFVLGSVLYGLSFGRAPKIILKEQFAQIGKVHKRMQPKNKLTEHKRKALTKAPRKGHTLLARSLKPTARPGGNAVIVFTKDTEYHKAKQSNKSS